MGIRHARGLPSDSIGDAPVAVAETGNSCAAGAIDDLPAVGEMQVDALTADRSWWDGAGTVQHPAADTSGSHVKKLPYVRYHGQGRHHRGHTRCPGYCFSDVSNEEADGARIRV
jgi:hypothetical protein